ncbi:MAG: hypothetical protein J5554_10965 [Paludibacteraceae bacterium]|nr:hypothetical protein [Paludibacteraceae bacterium]
MLINEQKYNLIRDGVEVSCTMPNGSVEKRKAKVIDFKDPESCSFIAVRELCIMDSCYKQRDDNVGYVNGLPLLFVELKNHYAQKSVEFFDYVPLGENTDVG